jgi:SnoaL-like domain
MAAKRERRCRDGGFSLCRQRPSNGRPLSETQRGAHLPPSLAGKGARGLGSPRRVRPNAATANLARFDAAMAARDADAIVAHVAFGEDVEHATGAIYEARAMLPTWLSLMRAEDGTYWTEPLATLGDALALSRQWASASGIAGGKFDVGPYEIEHILLNEVDAQGQHRRTEIFALNRLGDAIARLYERYAELLPDGTARTRAAATARSVAVLLGPFDPEGYAVAFAPDIEVVDHRILGTFSAHGAQAVLQNHRSWLELADKIGKREEDVLGLRSDACLVRRTFFGVVRASGGAFERQFIMLWFFGTDGLLSRWEFYDADRDAEALARFDELVGSDDAASAAARSPTHFANAATRAVLRLSDAAAAREWGRFAALFPAGFRIADRRRMVQLEIDRDPFLDAFRRLFEMTSSTPPDEVLATRGDRLALLRSLWIGADGDSGSSEIEWLTIMEVDGRGEPAAAVTFDPDDLDAAYAELDARFDAGEGAASGTQMKLLVRDLAARDWDALAARLAPDLVVYDHRPLGWDTLRGPQAYIEMLKTLVDLAPDAQIRVDHVRVCERGLLAATTVFGTRDGGAFEDPRVVVVEGDDQGRIRRIDFYTLEQFDQAQARFAGLRPAFQRPPADVLDPLHIPPNAASRAGDRNHAALEARDWEAVTRACAPTMTFDDRRRSALLTGDRDMFIASSRVMASVGARMSRTLLATAGDRLSLEHHRWTGGTEAGTPSIASLGGAHGLSTGFEAEFLSLREVDAEGRIVAIIAFDPENRRAASAEMLDRYARSEAARWIPAAAFEALRAMNAHDLARLRAALPDDYVFDDHRRVGLGRLESADKYVGSVAALFEQAANWAVEALYAVATEKHGTLAMAHGFGTLVDGGDFEQVYIWLLLYRGNRLVSMELFESDDLDTARARFEELRPDPLRIPPNAAVAFLDRIAEPFEARDWGALRALASDDFTYADRGKRAQLSGDVELWFASLQFVADVPGSGFERELIGTVGDRIAVERMVWTGEPDTGAFEIESTSVVEVDANGRLVAWIDFDPDDRRAAFAEAQSRFVAGEAAATGGQAPIVVLVGAFARHDWETLRRCLADNLVFRDRRELGLLGVLGRDEWIESMRVQADLAPDSDVETIRIIAWNRYGRVEVSRVFGTLRDGGPFENVLLRVMVTDGDRIQHFEVFDIGDADKALARFDELCSELQIRNSDLKK